MDNIEFFEEIKIKECGCDCEAYVTQDYFSLERDITYEHAYGFDLENSIKIRDLLNRWIAKHEQQAQQDVPTTDKCNIKNI